MSREHDPKIDGPRKLKTSTADEQNGTELIPLGKFVNKPAPLQNTAQASDNTPKTIHSVPDAVINHMGSFLLTQRI